MEGVDLWFSEAYLTGIFKKFAGNLFDPLDASTLNDVKDQRFESNVLQHTDFHVGCTRSSYSSACFTHNVALSSMLTS